VSLTMMPERQGAFHFTASNCIGCHSCEAACSEKNGLPPHVAWRKVGFVETGTFPDYRRINISMACNHCDDPVCLKGCPTRAYVKYEDTGAVIQDSMVCFGCQYCTWVCPYGAPVFDPLAGTVSKCNFCVDRQIVGLKPACVEACLGHALDFGPRERLGETHDQVARSIPGFPTPDITRPNVRFAFHGELADGYGRPDTMNLAYHANTSAGHAPRVAAPSGTEKQAPLAWKSLRSSESPLVAFTLIAQGVVGSFAALTGLGAVNVAPAPGLTTPLLTLMCALLGYGLFTSTMHLGRPRYFYRAMNNLRYSWVSREILFVGGFMTLLLACTGNAFTGLLAPPLSTALGWATVLFGVTGIYCMVHVYRIPARPFWDHMHTNIAFFKSTLLLGPLAVALALAAGAALSGLPLPHAPWLALTSIALAATLFGCAASRAHGQDMARAGGEAEASLDRLTKTYGNFQRLRQWMGVALAGVLAGASMADSTPLAAALAGGALVLAMAGEVVERSLFYLVVVPTTMPGALFLKNAGFEQLARDTGLAEDRHVGVAPDLHHGDPPKLPEPPRPAPAIAPVPEPEAAR